MPDKVSAEATPLYPEIQQSQHGSTHGRTVPDVVEQPEPMKELSFWNIDAPHLHDYFVSKQGQFKLTELPNGNTLLEGTTRYYHNIRPTFYWQLWSNHIIHKIHERVLTHIKKNAETEKKPAYHRP